MTWRDPIAVTKYPPDVPEQEMQREGIFAFRWQDVHRHLASQLPKTAVDRFLYHVVHHIS